MKKIVIAVFIGLLLAASGIAKAGNSTELPSIPKGKNDGGNKVVKSQSKYTFTLFSFFTTESNASKTDSTSTLRKSPVRKEEEVN